MGRSVNRRVFYTADLIASNEELEFPHTKSFIAGLVFFSGILSYKLTGMVKCQLLAKVPVVARKHFF